MQMRSTSVLGALALVILGACAPMAVSTSASAAQEAHELVVPTGPSRESASSSTAYGQALNAYRKSHGLSKLTRNAKLETAAQRHAVDLAAMGKLSHTGSNGSSIVDRALAQGYNYATVAENVAWVSPGGINKVLTEWDKSPSHRTNMRLKDVTEFGIARAGDYWVLMLGRQK